MFRKNSVAGEAGSNVRVDEGGNATITSGRGSQSYDQHTVRSIGKKTGGDGFIDSNKLKSAMRQTGAQVGYEQPSPLQDANLPLKFNLPYSLAPMPSHLNN